MVDRYNIAGSRGKYSTLRKFGCFDSETSVLPVPSVKTTKKYNIDVAFTGCTYTINTTYLLRKTFCILMRFV